MKRICISLLLIGGLFGYIKWNDHNVLKDYTLETLAAESKNRTDELVLVNHEHAYEGLPQQLVHIEKDASKLIRVVDDMEMEQPVYEAMIDMAEAAVRDGILTLQLNSAYRSADHQAELFQQYGDEYALPAGYSEHQTGLALDIGVTTGKIEGTDAEKWLAKHAAAYGFVLRYPAYKVDITNIEFEPWHFRYVGLPHSLIMQEKDLVLEEYVAYLQKEEAVKYVRGIEEFIIQYKDVSDHTIEFDVPAGYVTQMSNDNVGGIIVTTLIK